MGREKDVEYYWKILLVDDDEDDYILIGDMLSEIPGVKYHLRWAPIFEKALEELKSETWDVILLDFDLGGKSGLDFIEEADRLGVKTPILMVTGRGSYEVDVEAMQAGADDYVSKDQLNSSFLEHVIRFALERREHKEELEQKVRKRTEELQKANEELQQAFEELRVLEEELRIQNDQLVEGYHQLEVERKEYQSLFENAPIGFFITNENGLIEIVNQTAASLLNVPSKYLLGKPLAAYIDIESRSWFREKIELFKSNKNAKIQMTKISLQPRSQAPVSVFLTVTPKSRQNQDKLKLFWLVTNSDKHQ
jgi:PAS domain S-box-containing protein